MYRLGIDVGETNTDAVLLDRHSQIVQTVKKPTSPDIVSGICAVLEEIIERNQTDPKDIAAVMIGTTHCLQALRKKRKSRQRLRDPHRKRKKRSPSAV